MPKYQIKHYGKDAMGPEVVAVLAFTNDGAAKSYAGRLSKRVEGPVDVARAPGLRSIMGDDWAARYLTTAAPSEYHASGYRFERLV